MITTERIPLELWMKIIRDATYVPEALDTTLPDALPAGGIRPGLYSQEVFAMMRHSIVTKWAISLVCKSWSSICLNFLHEIIIVREAVHLPLLVELLSRMDPGASNRIQRLDFVYIVPRGITVRNGVSYPAKRLVREAAQLVRLCRNLRIFSCRPIGDYDKMKVLLSGSRYLRSALLDIAGTLESIEWNLESRFSYHAWILQLHRRSLHMRSMLTPETRPPRVTASLEQILSDGDCDKDSIDESDSETIYGGCSEEKNCNPNLPSLHTLSFHERSAWRSPHYLSNAPQSLRHVVVEKNPGPLDLLQTLLSSNPQIDTLTFRFQTPLHMDRFTSIFINTLIIPFQGVFSDIHVPSVERIGLTGAESPIPEHYDYAFERLVGECGDEQFPKLRLVRFVDAPLARTLKKRNLQFKLLDRKCRSKSVRLEDERGCVMVPRL